MYLEVMVYRFAFFSSSQAGASASPISERLRVVYHSSLRPVNPNLNAVFQIASCKIKCDTESPSPKVSIGAQTALAGWGDRGKDDNESFPLVEAMK